MNATSVSSTRRYDIDWLRVLLILTVLVFHSLRFFDTEGWNVKSATTYVGVQIVITFMSRWMMPAIFVISGMATFYALGKRGGGRFLKDRSLRLLVPLLVGLLTQIPMQDYLAQVSQGGYSGSFWQWYPSMFNGLMYINGNFNWIGGHLWYLEVLFLFSLICLPLFLWLRHGSGQRALSWLGDRLSAPWALYLPVLIIIVFSATLNPDTGSIFGRVIKSEGYGGWNLPSHLVFFLTGFVFASSPAMQASARRIRWISLVGGIVTFLIVGILALAFSEENAAFGTPFYLVWSVCSSLVCWAIMLAIFGFGMERLNVRTPALDYANEAVLPFYVMHQTVLFVVAFYVLQWAIPDAAKWVIILLGTFAIIMALYELLVRRINLLRVLFGMKPVSKQKLAEKPVLQVS